MNANTLPRYIHMHVRMCERTYKKVLEPKIAANVCVRVREGDVCVGEGDVCERACKNVLE